MTEHVVGLIWEAWSTRKKGAGAIAHASAPASQRARLADMVAHARAWRKAEAGLRIVVAEHGLEHIAVERGGEPPEQGRSGKFREVIPLSGTRT